MFSEVPSLALSNVHSEWMVRQVVMVMEVAHTVIGGKKREATERKRWREIYI